MNNTIIIDYGMGNTDSVIRAIEKCGGEPTLSNSTSDIESASHIVLPGVGNFQKGIENMDNLGIIPKLEEQIFINKIPFLGICLGMQLLAESSLEGGKSKGLGWIKGRVVKFEKTINNERIPHIGWNDVNFKKEDLLFTNMASGKDFYFVHSYHFICRDKSNIIATTPYCGDFVSAVKHNNIYGVQFHPEKSQKNGFKILNNFLSIA